MKKNTILLLSLLLISTNYLQAQVKTSGLEGKRFSIEANVGISMVPSVFIFFGSSIQEKFSYESDLFSIKYNFELGYTLTNKIKASFLYSKSNFSINEVNIEVYENDNYFKQYNFNDVQFKSLGIKGSYYVRDFIAPVGGSIGLSLKRSSVNITDHIFSISKDILDTADTKISYFTVGIHFDNMVFLSSKVPMYLKYGISSAIGFRRRVEER